MSTPSQVDELVLRYLVAFGPDMRLPDPDVPAPIRFLPEYDNLLLSHADRSRFIEDGRRVPLPPGNGANAGTVLVDGWYRADWRIEQSKDQVATLIVRPFGALNPAQRHEIEAEGRELLAFAAAGSEVRDVRIVA